MILLPGMLRDGHLSLGRTQAVLHNWALSTSLQKTKTSFGKFCARSLVRSALPGAACDPLVEEEFKDPEFRKRVAGLERMLRVRSRVNKSSGGSPSSGGGGDRADSQVQDVASVLGDKVSEVVVRMTGRGGETDSCGKLSASSGVVAAGAVGPRSTPGVLRVQCEEYISTTEKWLRKLYVHSNNIYMSDEDNNHDTNYINNFHDANHDTRKLHM